jgi:pimeloyl-ACP methyl ester carboxylesterase
MISRTASASPRTSGSGSSAAAPGRSCSQTAGSVSRLRRGPMSGTRCGTSASARSTGRVSDAATFARVAAGLWERNVEDIHALIRAAGLRRPVILVGHSTGGLDSLLYARNYRPDLDGLVVVDSPSESAPPPPSVLNDRRTRLDSGSGLRTLRQVRDLGDLPILVLSHGRPPLRRGRRNAAGRRCSASSPETPRTRFVSSPSTAGI